MRMQRMDTNTLTYEYANVTNYTNYTNGYEYSAVTFATLSSALRLH